MKIFSKLKIIIFSEHSNILIYFFFIFDGFFFSGNGIGNVHIFYYFHKILCFWFMGLYVYSKLSCPFILDLSFKVNIHKDCQVYKFLRTDAPDVCEEIPPEVTVKLLTDQQEFEIEGEKVKIVHTPGHTTDHVVITTADGTLFSGDCILGNLKIIYTFLQTFMPFNYR